MVRITDRHLIQRVADDLVILDETTTAEIVMPAAAAAGPAARRAFGILGPALTIDEHRQELHVAMALLKVALADACPGPHTFVQHRDRQPPWCEACRRTRSGERIGEEAR